MHVAPANNSGKCMMNYGSEILCRDNGMRNCGPQPYLKIFQNIFQSTSRWREKISHSAMPCTSVNDGKLASLHISISSVLGCVLVVSQVGTKGCIDAIFGKTQARPVILYAHVFSTTKPLEVKNGVFDDICGGEASSICT